MNLDDLNPATGAIPEPLSPLEPTYSPTHSEGTAPLGLDDISASDPQAAPLEQQGETAPMSNEQMVGLIGFFSSMGLPPEAAAAYTADLENNSMLEMFLPLLELPEALAKYGLGNGTGKMPEWMRLALGAALVGYTVYTTRAKYAKAFSSAADASGPLSTPEVVPPEPEIQNFFV